MPNQHTAPIFNWTPERIEVLRAGFAAGDSFAVIGVALGAGRYIVRAEARKLGLRRERIAPSVKGEKPADSRWTPEVIEAVKTRWLKGESAADIGPAFGFSRSAVIAKMNREGVERSPRIGIENQIEARRRSEARKPKTPKAPKVPRVANKVSQKAVAARRSEAREKANETVALRLVASQPGIPLLALKNGRCRYAVNDPAPGEDHLFCGEKTKGGSWCEEHRLIVSAPKEPDKRLHRSVLHFAGRDTGVNHAAFDELRARA